MSASTGVRRSIRRWPASVGTTLRVVRLSNLKPSFASRRLTATLSPEAETPPVRAASRKPPARATDTKAARSFSSKAIVHHFEQPVLIIGIYFTAAEADSERHQPLTPEGSHGQRTDFRDHFPASGPARESHGLRRHATCRAAGFRAA